MKLHIKDRNKLLKTLQMYQILWTKVSQHLYNQILIIKSIKNRL